MELVTATQTPTLACNSCEHCRKVHKKCDKKLPSCSTCERKGLQCVYEIIKKKKSIGKTSISKNRYQPYNNVNSLSTTTINEQMFRVNLSERNIIKQNVTLSLISLQKQTVEMFKLVTPIVMPTKVFDFLISTANFENLTTERKALLYSVHANIEQRLGNSLNNKRIEHVLESAKTLLNLVSYDWNNYHVIATQYFLSFSLSNHGKHKEAQFYLNSMNFSIDQLKKKIPNLEPIENMLIKLNQYANLEINHAIAIDRNNTILFNLPFLSILEEIPDIIKLFSNNNYYNNNESLLNELFPKESFTKENLNKHLNTIENITNQILLFIKIDCKNELKKKFEIELFTFLFKNMLKLLCILMIDKTQLNLIISICNEIGNVIENEYFKILPSQIIIPFIVSSKVLINIIKSNIIVNNILLLEILRKHLQGIKMLGNKFKRIEIFHGDLMKEMEFILNGLFENNNNSGSISSSCCEGFVDSTQQLLLEEDVLNISEVDSLLKEITSE